MWTADALFARAHEFDRRAGHSDELEPSLFTALAAVYRLLAELAQADGCDPALAGNIGVGSGRPVGFHLASA